MQSVPAQSLAQDICSLVGASEGQLLISQSFLNIASSDQTTDPWQVLPAGRDTSTVSFWPKEYFWEHPFEMRHKQVTFFALSEQSTEGYLGVPHINRLDFGGFLSFHCIPHVFIKRI